LCTFSSESLHLNTTPRRNFFLNEAELRILRPHLQSLVEVSSPHFGPELQVL
jgi:hypothetical protein